MEKVKSIVTQVNIYRDGDNPIFGESVISVSICDDAAGPYLQIYQTIDDEDQSLKIGFEELDELISVCNMLKEKCIDFD